jgi:hypothetical protein
MAQGILPYRYELLLFFALVAGEHENFLKMRRHGNLIVTVKEEYYKCELVLIPQQLIH